MSGNGRGEWEIMVAGWDLVLGVVIEPRSHGLGPTKQHHGSHRKRGCPAAQPHADGVSQPHTTSARGVNVCGNSNAEKAVK